MRDGAGGTPALAFPGRSDGIGRIQREPHAIFGGALSFSWLTREGLILYNPASDLEMPRGEHPLPRAILETLYSTGIRHTELCQLDQGDLDAERGLVRVAQGKGKKDRFAPIGGRALSWIEKCRVESRPGFCRSINEAAHQSLPLGQPRPPPH